MLSSDCNEQQLEWLFSRRAEKEFYFCFQKKIKIIPITLPVNPCGKNTLHQEIVLLNVCQLIYVCMSGKDALNTLVSPFRLISFWKLRVKMSPKGFLFCPLKSWLKNWRLLDWKLLVSVTVILVCETGGHSPVCLTLFSWIGVSGSTWEWILHSWDTCSDFTPVRVGLKK